MRTFFTLPILLLAAAVARAEDPLVVLAAARTGHIEFFDASLSPLGAIGVNQLVESVTASPDGRRLLSRRKTCIRCPAPAAVCSRSTWKRTTCAFSPRRLCLERLRRTAAFSSRKVTAAWTYSTPGRWAAFPP
jgi:hypothetical protein